MMKFVQVINPNMLLKPGQMFCVDPRAIDMLRMKQFKKQTAGAQLIENADEIAASLSDESSADKAEAPSSDANADSEASASEEDSAIEEGLEAEATADASDSDSPSTASSLDKFQPAFDLNAAPTSLNEALEFTLPDYAAPFLFIPPYLEVNFPTASAVYIRHPTAGPGYSEIPTPYEADGDVVRLAWVSRHSLRQGFLLIMRGSTQEWYNKVGRRRRRHSKIGNDFKLKRDDSHIYKGDL